MVYPISRSLAGDLNEGATDGGHKKIIRDRGGLPEDTTHRSRIDLDDIWYGIHEEEIKVRADGKAVHTPNYVATPPVTLGTL